MYLDGKMDLMEFEPTAYVSIIENNLSLVNITIGPTQFDYKPN